MRSGASRSVSPTNPVAVVCKFAFWAEDYGSGATTLLNTAEQLAANDPWVAGCSMFSFLTRLPRLIDLTHSIRVVQNVVYVLRVDRRLGWVKVTVLTDDRFCVIV